MASHRIGRLLGIEVHVAYFLYLFIGLIFIVKLRQVSSVRGTVIVTSLLLWPLFVLLHELGHSLVAIKEGMTVRKILLHAVGGVAELQGLIPGPFSEILIALAGPFVNLFIGALLFLPLLLLDQTNLATNLSAEGTALAGLLTVLMLVNMSLALFNFLPIFPMDGGRVATAIAVMALGPKRGIRTMGRVALVGIGLLALAGAAALWSGEVRMGLALILIGTFLYTTGRQELQARMFVAHYASSAAAAPAPQRQPWEVPDWSPTEGFAEPETKSASWFERRRQKKQEEREAREQAEAEALKERVDAVLAKVKRDGLGGLTAEERQALDQASQSYRKS